MRRPSAVIILFPDGKKYKTGTIGTVGTTSFFPSKNLGAYGDGGALYTRDSHLSEIFKMIANHGKQKILSRNSGLQ